MLPTEHGEKRKTYTPRILPGKARRKETTRKT
jgi:hypothetical protein